MLRDGQVAATVAEGVELFDIIEAEAGLGEHPATQAELKCSVADGIEGAEGQGVAARQRGRDGQHLGARAVGGDDHGRKPDLQWHLSGQ